MQDFRPEHFNRVFNQLDPKQPHTENVSADELTPLEFETTDETARSHGFSVFHLRVMAFVIR